jgi:hypothetical protein
VSLVPPDFEALLKPKGSVLIQSPVHPIGYTNTDALFLANCPVEPKQNLPKECLTNAKASSMSKTTAK